MWYYDDGLDYSNPADREIIEKRKQLEREERIKYIKEQRRSYLKGQRGKRLYYDRDDYYLEDEEAQIKCVFTRDLRREKLFAYLKYLNGRKVFVRDLAWKFAVTERTIQNDLKFLIDNGFIERQINKTFKGRQTKNSYIVHPEKQKDLAYGGDRMIMPIFVAKQDDNYFVCLMTDYKRNEHRNKIEDCEFWLNERTITDKTNLEKATNKLSREYFKQKVSGKYMGEICEYQTHGEFYKEKERRHRKYRSKFFFTLTLLDELYSTKRNATWISLKVAPRRIKQYHINKGIHQAKKVLGVK